MSELHDRRGADQHDELGTFSLVGVFNVALRHRRHIAASALCFFILATGWLIVQPREYVSLARFMPQTGGQAIPRFAEVATQLGVNLPSASAGESIQFYVDLLQSPELLLQVIQTHYQVQPVGAPGDTVAGTLLDLLEIDGETDEERLIEGIREFQDRLSVSTNPQSGLVTIRFRAPWRELAARVNSRLLELVNTFNLERRQSRAAAERRFIEGRLERARQELESAESELERFLERNRTYQTSPQLSFEAARLKRRVDLHEQVYSTLAQAYEQARIAEVRNTPVVTIVDHPATYVRRVNRRVVFTLFLSLCIGVTIGLFIAFTKDYFVRERAESPGDYSQFDALRQATLRDLASVRRLLRTRGSKRSAESAPPGQNRDGSV